MHRYGKAIRLIAMILVIVTLAVSMPALAYNDNVSFSDVPSGEWYAGYVQKCAWLEIINGFGDGTFRPNDNVKRGEFIKMLAIAAELYTTKTSTAVHWAAPYWYMLSESGVLEDVSIPCTYASLEQTITRYEMAALLRNTLYNVYGENTVEVDSPETNIGDYSVISMAYRSAVEQSYGKGILCGDENGDFNGDDSLTRAQAAKVIVCLLWPSERQAVSFATEVMPVLNPPDSFAFQYRTMNTAERRLALFGDENKTYFTGNEGNLGDYIVTIQVLTWDINKSGQKYTRTWNLNVNKMVADEVEAIFDEIYNDPERFPIHSLGGARFSDTLRHSWGCAIDINPVENCYINYSTGQTVGKYNWTNSTSPYCIFPGGSVVRAFAKYGWGWGGEGWTSAVDYMHFSILASGG
ncbi:MAG: hypothetical protein EOM54_06545 [Clostridia bacterium]|nr:hypothetical protein [Clostridia bacterium]